MEDIKKVQENAENESFGKQIGAAMLHLLYRFAYLLGILPFGLWKNAIIRLSKQKKECALDVTAIESEYPFLSWCKRFIFDFLIDGLTAIAWPLFLIESFIEGEWKFITFISAIVLLYTIYWSPVILAILRDVLTIFVVMPIRWLISFFKRPAKTYDLTHVGTIKKD